MYAEARKRTKKLRALAPAVIEKKGGMFKRRISTKPLKIQGRKESIL